MFQDLKAQSDAHFNNFIEVENFYNPAAMNRNSRTNVVGALSMQMAGYTNAPVSMFIGANMPIPFGKQKNSLGVGLFNETLARLVFLYPHDLYPTAVQRITITTAIRCVATTIRPDTTAKRPVATTTIRLDAAK